MSHSEDNHSFYGPRLSVMDFFTFTETMQTCFSPDDPEPRLGLSHLNFVINAPLDYYPPTNAALATLYFDQSDCPRILPEGAYQVSPPHHLSTHEFMTWAQHSVNMISYPFMHKGMICIDVSDLIWMLQACNGRKLTLDIIHYDDPLQVPWERLQRLRFKNLFAALFAGQDLTMKLYTDLGNALEEISQNLGCMSMAVNYFASTSPIVLLLGELEA